MMSINRKSIRNWLSAGAVIVTLSFSLVCSVVFASDNEENNSASAPQRVSEAQAMFNAMSTSEKSDPDALDNFIRQFPDSNEARVAYALRYVLLKNDQTDDTYQKIDAYNKFVEQYPEKKQTQIALAELYGFYQEKNTVPGYYDFIQRHPDSIQALVAFHHVEQIMYEFAELCNTVDNYDAFIEAFPDAPQVKSALEKSKQILIETEEKEFTKFQNSEPKPNREALLDYVSEKFGKWEIEVNNFLKKYPNIEFSSDTSSTEKIEVRNQLFKIDRQADALQHVYGKYDRPGRVQNTRNSLEVIKRLEKIQKTLDNNHNELLAKLDEETNKICQKLDVLHKDNQEIVKTLNGGFKQLHQDLVTIHEDLGQIKQKLDDMDRQLQIISNTLTTIASGGSSTILTAAGGCIHEAVKVVSLVRNKNVNSNNTFNEAIATETMCCIAQNGYENYPDVWVSEEAAEVSNTANSNLWRVKSGSRIARYIGALAGDATRKYVPLIGENLDSLVEKVTTISVDHYGKPFVKRVIQKTTEAKEFQWVFIEDSAKETWGEFKDVIKEDMPKVLLEEEGNLLVALKKVSDKANIDEKWSDPLINGIKERDVNKVIIPWAENMNVNPKLIEYYKKYLALSAEMQ